MQAMLIMPLRERERWKKKEGNRGNEEKETEKEGTIRKGFVE